VFLVPGHKIMVASSLSLGSAVLSSPQHLVYILPGIRVLAFAMANRLLYVLAGASLLLKTAITAATSDYPELVPRTWNGQQYGCKCYFGDSCWPGPTAWDALNATVDGKLAVYVPPESACHNTFNGTLGTIPTYDAAKCAAVTANYSGEQWVYVLQSYWPQLMLLTHIPSCKNGSSCHSALEILHQLLVYAND
jgi:hypothetical protein